MKDATNKTKFFNRELSWLMFNTRVLNEIKNNIPPLDKLKFLAIYSTNLDEFYMVRVAGLKRLYTAGVIECSPDNLTPLDQLTKIRDYIHKEKNILEKYFNATKKELASNNLFINSFNDLSSIDKKSLNDYFYSYLYPIIVPIIVDSKHPFPHLNNLSFGMIIKLKDSNSKYKFGIIRISRMLPRFIAVTLNIYIPIEIVVGEFISDVFKGYEAISYTTFRVTRNADFEIEEEEADDFMAIMTEGLKARKRGEIVRLELGNTDDKSLVEFITHHTKVDIEDVYYYNVPLNLSALWEIVNNKRLAHLSSPILNPKILPPFDNTLDFLSVIDNNDIALFHPYESFDPVVSFIQNVAIDPDVYSIKMTLYRAGKNSPIIKALSEAAENNKQVSVLVELKARFDEENNLYWAKALESAGAHVMYGVPGLKIHAKIALVIKKIGNSFKKYVHLSTGNYNPATAKIYTDISYFTSNENITNDALSFFHALSTGYTNQTKLNFLLLAPTQIKSKLMSLIDEEAKMGKDGYIIIKVNAIVDIDIINALYKASIKGVKIEMIVRGICSLIPGINQLSDNIRVISIVGKYLEHARIYYFKHSNPKIYFASADLMPRNLERRVEIMTPIYNKAIEEKLFGILKIQLEDNVQSYELQSNGEYIRIKNNENKINSQEECEKYINTIFNNKTQDYKMNMFVSKKDIEIKK